MTRTTRPERDFSPGAGLGISSIDDEVAQTAPVYSTRNNVPTPTIGARLW